MVFLLRAPQSPLRKGHPIAEKKNTQLLGLIAIMTAVLIWAGWIVATREAVQRDLIPLDIAILRYGTPALLLAPVWLRRGLFPKGESALRLAIMTAGWGGPFVMLISTGLQSVPAYLFGPLVPGLLPMVVAAYGTLALGERITSMRWIGLAFIAAAVACIVVPAVLSADMAILRGVPFLLTACAGWSAFTIAYRGSGLNGVESAAYVCLYSSPFLMIAAMAFGTDIPSYSITEFFGQAFVQGVLSGMASVIAYAYAIRALGLARASAFTSLVPAFAALGGWLILGEAVSFLGWASVVAAGVGVYLVNRAVA